MATIRPRNGKWQVQIRLAIGPHLTRSFHQKADAVKWARATESDIQAGRYRPSGCPETLYDILKRYLNELTGHKRSAHKERLRIDRLMRETFVRLKVRDISKRPV